MRSKPNRRCSGATERLANRAASSREKARISDTLGENWLVTTIYDLTFYYKLFLAAINRSYKFRAKNF